MFNPNILKLPPWFSGQMGVPGSDTPEGLRTHPQGLTFYVDTNHPDANDQNDGTDPRYPLASIQEAVDKVQNRGDQIMIAPGSYAESVVTPNYVTGPNYVHIIGLGGGQRQAVQWSSGAANEPCLDLRAVGWTVENVKFLAPTTSACVELRHTDSGANDIAINTIIKNCHFYGQTTGLYGVLSHGAYLVTIEGCLFENFNNVANTATALATGTTPLAIPFRNVIRDCIFMENDNHVIFACNGSLFLNNVFMKGYTYSPVTVLRTSLVGNPGDDNHVHGNFFGGLDYSITGGFVSGAADSWVGNFSDDVAEAEVGDNGLTIAIPT